MENEIYIWDDDKIMEFLYHSNKIENINIEKEEYVKYSQIPEIKGHLQAFRYLLLKASEDILTETCLLDVHKLLMKKLLWDKAGKYRKCSVRIGYHIPPKFNLVPHLMNNLILDINESCDLSEDKIWEFHDKFEIIHPFIDGNGRMGRLLLNYLRFKNNYDLKIIKFTSRIKYYNKIDERKIKLGL